MPALVSDVDRESVNQAVREAEAGTSAEIVPVLAAASGRYERAEDLVGLWFAVAAIGVTWLASPLPARHAGDWGAPAWQTALILCGVVLVAFACGAFAASRIAWLRRLCAPRAQQHDQVQRQARAAFFDSRVHHTAGRSGVLLYVSLFERMAVVLADEQVMAKLGQEAIDALCSQLTTRLAQASPATALIETVRAAGTALAPLLPRSAEDVNELPDALVVIES